MTDDTIASLSVTTTQISIPDLNENPYYIQDVVLNNKTYYFEYFWNIRHLKAYLSIYIMDNNIKTYILKSRVLTKFINLAKYIINDNWSGSLYFNTLDISNIYDYTQENISTDYQLTYFI